MSLSCCIRTNGQLNSRTALLTKVGRFVFVPLTRQDARYRLLPYPATFLATLAGLIAIAGTDGDGILEITILSHLIGVVLLIACGLGLWCPGTPGDGRCRDVRMLWVGLRTGAGRHPRCPKLWPDGFRGRYHLAVAARTSGDISLGIVL